MTIIHANQTFINRFENVLDMVSELTTIKMTYMF